MNDAMIFSLSPRELRDAEITANAAETKKEPPEAALLEAEA